MTGDISRQTFDARKHYSKVTMQQGRVQLDADWNEQQDILLHHSETTATDVIGQSGVPEGEDGFKIEFTPDGTDLSISPGRIYVGGSLCELEESITYKTQPDYPNPEALQDTENTLYLVYLDVWQRDITALDDGRIREVALGGPDSAARSKTIWQVKLFQGHYSDELEQWIKEKDETSAQITQQEEELKRLGPPQSVPARQRIERIEGELTPLREKFRRLERQITHELQAYDSGWEPDEWKEQIRPSTGTLNATTYDDQAGRSGYQGQENQLYRVEIHDQKTQTFKWARNNASTAARVSIKGNIITISGSGQGGISSFNAGQLIEVVNDERELKAEPGALATIQRVDTLKSQLILDSSPGDGENIQIRAWDRQGTIIQGRGQSRPYQELADGIKIQFSNGSYHNGDYWLIPARTSTKDIEWPSESNKGPIPQLRRGIYHHYSRLAVIRSRLTKQRICDVRRRFFPLAADAMHVVHINWDNDSRYRDEFLEDKTLRITLDAPPDPGSISPATVIITVEAAGSKEEGSVMHIVRGDVSVEGRTIAWRWNKEQNEGVVVPVFERLEREGHELVRDMQELFHVHKHTLRVRVTLKGHCIWRNHDGRWLYLDGQVFGKPGTRAKGQPRIDLQLPSGAGVSASDFESWFYLKE